MNWSDVGKYIEGGASVLGNVLTGNIPGAISTVGSMISGKLGTDNSPDAVMEELKKNPDAILKLKKLQDDHQEELIKLGMQKALVEAKQATARIESVNTTMQSESKSEHWPQWSWRPAWGFISAVTFAWVCYHVCSFIEANPGKLSQVPQMVAAFAELFGIPGAILGVASWHRGKMKRVQAGENTSGGMLNKLAGAVSGAAAAAKGKGD